MVTVDRLCAMRKSVPLKTPAVSVVSRHVRVGDGHSVGRDQLDLARLAAARGGEHDDDHGGKRDGESKATHSQFLAASPHKWRTQRRETFVARHSNTTRRYFPSRIPTNSMRPGAGK